MYKCIWVFMDCKWFEEFINLFLSSLWINSNLLSVKFFTRNEFSFCVWVHLDSFFHRSNFLCWTQYTQVGRSYTLPHGFVPLLDEIFIFVGKLYRVDRVLFSRRSSTSRGGRSFFYSPGRSVKTPRHFLSWAKFTLLDQLSVKDLDAIPTHWAHLILSWA